MAQDWLGSFAGGRRFCAQDRTCARSHPCEIRGRSLSVSDGGARGSYLPYLATVYGLRARGGQRGTAGGFLTATCKRLVAIRSQRVYWPLYTFLTLSLVLLLGVGAQGSHLGPRPLSRLLGPLRRACSPGPAQSTDRVAAAGLEVEATRTQQEGGVCVIVYVRPYFLSRGMISLSAPRAPRPRGAGAPCRDQRVHLYTVLYT